MGSLAACGLERSTARARLRAALLAIAIAAPAVPALATIYGLESAAGGTPSQAPTVLFSFEEAGMGITEIAAVTVAMAQADADALAHSPNHGLLAYQIIGSNSQLISLNPMTAVGTPIGSPLTGRSIRAAGFDSSDRLWVIDATASDLLEINPTTGAVIGSAVNLTLGGDDYVLDGGGSDIAFRSDGVAFVVDEDSAYTLNIGTGAMTLAFADTDLQSGEVPIFLVGAAFPAATATGNLYVFEVNGGDDVFFYANQTTPRTLYDEDPITENAGRGDLASLPLTATTPTPTATATVTATATATSTPTATLTSTPGDTATNTATPSSTSSPTATATSTSTGTPSSTATATATRTATATGTLTVLAPGAPEIPALSGGGLVLLAVILAGLAVTWIVRSRAG